MSPSAALGSYAPSDSISAADLSFPRGNFSQTLIDIGTIAVTALLVSATGIGLAAGVFILLFVKV